MVDKSEKEILKEKLKVEKEFLKIAKSDFVKFTKRIKKFKDIAKDLDKGLIEANELILEINKLKKYTNLIKPKSKEEVILNKAKDMLTLYINNVKQITKFRDKYKK